MLFAPFLFSYLKTTLPVLADSQVALVSSGPTDFQGLEAILKYMSSQGCILTLLAVLCLCLSSLSRLAADGVEVTNLTFVLISDR